MEPIPSGNDEELPAHLQGHEDEAVDGTYDYADDTSETAPPQDE